MSKQYKFLDGFTKDEIKFLEEVPEILREHSMLYAASIYNQKFNTDLTTKEFHDRFDDYMKQLIEGPKEEESSLFDTIEDATTLFLNEKVDEGDPQYKMEYFYLRKVLREYEAWKAEKFNTILESVKPQIKSWNGITNSMLDMTERFLRMI